MDDEFRPRNIGFRLIHVLSNGAKTKSLALVFQKLWPFKVRRFCFKIAISPIRMAMDEILTQKQNFPNFDQATSVLEEYISFLMVQKLRL